MKAYYNITVYITLFIREIIHDCEDYVKFYISNNESGKCTRLRKSKIRQDKDDRSYFITGKTKIYLDECMKIN